MKENTIVYTMTSKGEPATAVEETQPPITDDKKTNPVLIVALIVAVYFIAR
jgi:hypothetical protein